MGLGLLMKKREADGVKHLQTIIKTFSKSKTSALQQKLSVESGSFYFHYLISDGVVYLTLADKGYPKKLAYQYLEELQREFATLYHTEPESVARPYAFIKFGIVYISDACGSH